MNKVVSTRTALVFLVTCPSKRDFYWSNIYLFYLSFAAIKFEGHPRVLVSAETVDSFHAIRQIKKTTHFCV